MDVIATVNNSISIVKRLHEISKNVTEAEFRNLLADLSNDLADAKIEIAALKEQVASLSEENRTLKLTRTEVSEKPSVKWGCYIFADDADALYCTACWDTKRQKSLTTRLSSMRRMCPVCDAVFGS
jgi:hypothetical protein